jgi:predicted RNA methylase
MRRADGATYTPEPIIEFMIKWAAEDGLPERVVDPGAGSGRFLRAAARWFPGARLVAIEHDPVAALLLRAGIVADGLADRTTLMVLDYRAAALPETRGRTLFIGNPPYVRHHGISADWKTWFAKAAASCGIKASKLAGLHIHFFLKTMQLAKTGDYGAFITSAEWLDVNYGSVLRKLLADGLGGCALHVLRPEAMPFADATTTAAITCFRVGRRPDKLRVRSVDRLESLSALTSGREIPWQSLAAASRWSTIIRHGPRPGPGYIELGELCHVHRGQVTGGNAIWIAGDHAKNLPPDVLVPTVTKARDILQAKEMLIDADRLRKVIDLPVDLGQIDPAYRDDVERFLSWAKRNRADQSYIARHRKAWWAVGLREPAPIVCTYMARRPPVFVRNRCGARHINIAHGLYPRGHVCEGVLSSLTAWLRANVSVDNGRAYAGGLIKFEPRELERVPIPNLHELPA